MGTFDRNPIRTQLFLECSLFHNTDMGTTIDGSITNGSLILYKTSRRNI